MSRNRHAFCLEDHLPLTSPLPPVPPWLNDVEEALSPVIEWVEATLPVWDLFNPLITRLQSYNAFLEGWTIDA